MFKIYFEKLKIAFSIAALLLTTNSCFSTSNIWPEELQELYSNLCLDAKAGMFVAQVLDDCAVNLKDSHIPKSWKDCVSSILRSNSHVDDIKYHQELSLLLHLQTQSPSHVTPSTSNFSTPYFSSISFPIREEGVRQKIGQPKKQDTSVASSNDEDELEQLFDGFCLDKEMGCFTNLDRISEILISPSTSNTWKHTFIHALKRNLHI